MYSYLRGELSEKKSDFVTLDVHGVGYEISVPFKTYQKLPEIGSPLKLYTHCSYREDSQKLFGFSEEAEKHIFRLIISVSGIGPKVGLAVLSTFTVEELEEIILQQDAISLSRVPGVGKKVSERLLMELRDKMNTFSKKNVPDKEDVSDQVHQDVLMALISLGYKDQQARKILFEVKKQKDFQTLTFQSLMKECLASV
ncbi:Holliday junction DNA helicase RuvA [PVC group bacterium (ex Bugula neritina AB1)]|nr:Holliday junction DNA helicase RuvA [PVC group bacterium (ex Bugula neritina AB1)]